MTLGRGQSSERPPEGLLQRLDETDANYNVTRVADALADVKGPSAIDPHPFR
jgi:hypothetical protein